MVANTIWNSAAKNKHEKIKDLNCGEEQKYGQQQTKDDKIIIMITTKTATFVSNKLLHVFYGCASF